MCNDLGQPVFRFLSVPCCPGSSRYIHPGTGSTRMTIRQLCQHILSVGNNIIIVANCIHPHMTIHQIMKGANTLRHIAHALISSQAQQINRFWQHLLQIVIQPELQTPVAQQQFPTQFALGARQFQRPADRVIGSRSIPVMVILKSIPLFDNSLLGAALSLQPFFICIYPRPDIGGVSTAHSSDSSSFSLPDSLRALPNSANGTITPCVGCSAEVPASVSAGACVAALARPFSSSRIVASISGEIRTRSARACKSAASN